jgi:hypothetical protein
MRSESREVSRLFFQGMKIILQAGYCALVPPFAIKGKLICVFQQV